MIAGPSEVAIIADSTADPVFAAADMLAQAEHDEKAAAVLFTPDPDLAREVAAEIRRQIKPLPRKKIIQKSLSSFGAIIITADIDEAAALLDVTNADGMNLWQSSEHVAGQVVFHFHMHLLPRYVGDGLHVPGNRRRASDAELDGLATAMRQRLHD